MKFVYVVYHPAGCGENQTDTVTERMTNYLIKYPMTYQREGVLL